VIARRETDHGPGLGVHRWAVEQTIALLHWFRRLRIRWEIRDDIHQAFPSSASPAPSSAGVGCGTSHFVRVLSPAGSGLVISGGLDRFTGGGPAFGDAPLESS
jgi:hypothetical protein